MQTPSSRPSRHLYAGTALLALLAIVVATAWWLRQPAPSSEPASMAPEPSSPAPAQDDLFGADADAIARPPAPQDWASEASRRLPDTHVPEPVDAPLKPRLDALRALAGAGDAAAVLQLFEELRRCGDLRGRLHAFDTERWGTPGADKNPLVQEAREGSLQQIERDVANCEGITEEDLDDRFALVRQAAEGGDFAAIHQYAVHGSPLTEDMAAAFRDPEGLIAFKRDVVRLVTGAARRCSVQALYFLTHAYREGTWLRRDDARAQALFLLSQRMEGSTPSVHEPTPSAEAERQAGRMYQRYCR